MYLTLHVGLGTFRPVLLIILPNIKCIVNITISSKEAAEILNQTRKNHQRIISVGTTSTRALETIANKYNGLFKEDSGDKIYLFTQDMNLRQSML